MSSTNKTSLGLNQWEGADKPVRQDFVNDNVIIDKNLVKLNNEKVSNKYTRLTNGSDLFQYIETMPLEHMKIVRIMNSVRHPAGYSDDNDFIFTIYKLSDPLYFRVIAYDVRSNRTYSVAKLKGTLTDWTVL